MWYTFWGEMMILNIKIKYFNDSFQKIEKIPQGDWIDLRSAVDVKLKRGESTLIPLGIAMQLPKGYEAHIAPRSSTFKLYGVIQTNGLGIVDESYCGDNDQWFMPVYATRTTEIKAGDRICQFRLTQKMPKVNMCEEKNLSGENRGGHGSTGRR